MAFCWVASSTSSSLFSSMSPRSSVTSLFIYEYSCGVSDSVAVADDEAIFKKFITKSSQKTIIKHLFSVKINCTFSVIHGSTTTRSSLNLFKPKIYCLVRINTFHANSLQLYHDAAWKVLSFRSVCLSDFTNFLCVNPHSHAELVAGIVRIRSIRLSAAWYSE